MKISRVTFDKPVEVSPNYEDRRMLASQGWTISEPERGRIVLQHAEYGESVHQDHAYSLAYEPEPEPTPIKRKAKPCPPGAA